LGSASLSCVFRGQVTYQPRKSEITEVNGSAIFFRLHEKISKIEEKKSIENSAWIILAVAQRLMNKSEDRRILHSELVEETCKGYDKLGPVRIHEVLRYLIENRRILLEVENAAIVCYTIREPVHKDHNNNKKEAKA
jgi:hypothetical protein